MALIDNLLELSLSFMTSIMCSIIIVVTHHFNILYQLILLFLKNIQNSTIEIQIYVKLRIADFISI
jgi:hypothetical protein